MTPKPQDGGGQDGNGLGQHLRTTQKGTICPGLGISKNYFSVIVLNSWDWGLLVTAAPLP